MAEQPPRGPPGRDAQLGHGEGAAGPHSESDWAEAAHQLLLAYRRNYDYEAMRRARSPEVMKRPFETLETAFQFTSQVMVALLVPQVHPVVPWLSRFLCLRREYPLRLSAPLVAVLVSGLHAKFALDVANLWGFPPFLWVEPRPPLAELLHPLSIHGLELNLLNTLVGVSLGRLVVTLRHGLQYAVQVGAEQFPVGAQALARPVALRLLRPAAAILHTTTSTKLAPMVVDGLALLLREAQLSGHLLIPTAVRALWRQLRHLSPWDAGRPTGQGKSGALPELDEALCWDGVEDDSEVPNDLLCPITGQLFVHPVVLHGMVFESAAARRWVQATLRHPTLQGIWCRIEEIEPAPDVEALCHRLAAERGWVLRSARPDGPGSVAPA